jgi:hypothetical protein
MAKTAPILVEISLGELIDKITILEIKAERIADARKLANVRYALVRLSETCAATFVMSAALERLWADLKTVNEALWEIEDDIRLCEAEQDFGPRFIELARSVYRTNDRRAAIKKEIDQLFGSAMTDEKSYQDYGA